MRALNFYKNYLIKCLQPRSEPGAMIIPILLIRKLVQRGLRVTQPLGGSTIYLGQPDSAFDAFDCRAVCCDEDALTVTDSELR